MTATVLPRGDGSFFSWPSSPAPGRLRRPGAAFLAAGRPAGPGAMADDGDPGLTLCPSFSLVEGDITLLADASVLLAE